MFAICSPTDEFCMSYCNVPAHSFLFAWSDNAAMLRPCATVTASTPHAPSASPFVAMLTAIETAEQDAALANGWNSISAGSIR
jgi:hypothetical protein